MKHYDYSVKEKIISIFGENYKLEMRKDHSSWSCQRCSGNEIIEITEIEEAGGKCLRPFKHIYYSATYSAICQKELINCGKTLIICGRKIWS